MSKGGASGTTTSTGETTPWTEQQPYLKDIFSSASDLYKNNTPNYYPSSTYSPLPQMSTDALGSVGNIADYNINNTGSTTNKAIDNENAILGGTLTDDPGYKKLTTLQDTNPGTSNPGYGTLTDLSTSDRATNNVAGSTLTNNSNTNFGTAQNNPGAKTLSPIAAGDYVKAGNPYTKDLSDSVLADTVPSIEKQFIGGGTLASPETVRATTAGAVAGLAPSLFKDYDTQTTNQLTAAKDLADTTLKGGEDTTTAATGYGNLALGGIGYNTAAANDLGTQATTGYTAQTGAATDTSGAYNKGIGNQLDALKLAPTVQALPYTDLTQKYTAGTLQQKDTQGTLDDAVARWNYGETLPYDQLNQLIGSITGNYGGTTSLTQPYFDNSASSALGTVATGATAANALTSGTVGAGLTSLIGLI